MERDRTLTGRMEGGYREYSLMAREALGNGLSPDARAPRNTPYAETMQNLQPLGYAAATPDEITNPVTNGPTPNWATDGTVQLFRGEANRWVMGQTQAYSADESWDASAVGATFSAGTHPWRGVFFDEIPFFTNSDVFLWGTGLSRVTTPTVLGVGKHEGRLLLGGMAGDVFSSDVFGRVFQKWKDMNDSDRIAYSTQSWGLGWMMFGERGGGSSDRPFDALLSLLDMYTSQNQTDMEGHVMSRLEDREWGFALLRSPGAIQAFHELDDAPIVFGTNGVARLMPDGDIYRDQRLSGIGIAAPAAVGGDLDACVYLTPERELWKITPQQRPRRLKFSQHLGSLTLADVTISFDSLERTWWIADKAQAFILDDDDRLGGPMEIVPTSLVRDGGNLYGIARDTRSDDTKRTVLFRSLPLDIGERGRKMAQVIQVSREGVTNLSAGVDYRYNDETSTFRSGALCQGRKDGSVMLYPKVQFNDAKIKVQGDVANGTRGVIDRLRFQYQADDITTTRGTRGVPRGD